MDPNIDKPDIKKLVLSANLNESIIELDNYVSALCEWGCNIPVLSYPQRVFYFNQELEREVNNGGFELYFGNSSGRYANDTVKTLNLIGAKKTAGILASAIERFPGKIVPTDEEQLHEIFEQIRYESEDTWNGLDQKFFKYEDDLNSLNIEYIKNNIQSF